MGNTHRKFPTHPSVSVLRSTAIGLSSVALALTLSFGQTAKAQGQATGRKDCWINVKTGKPIHTAPLGSKPEDFLGDYNRWTDPRTGQRFAQAPDGSWVNVQTGQPIATAPLGSKPEDFLDDYNHWTDPRTGERFVRVACPPPQSATTTPPATPSAAPGEKKKVALQLRGFGGATFISGNTPATAGFDGAVLFPLANRVLVGPMAGFEWVDSSIVKTIGGGPPPSTFIHTSVGFKTGNFGGPSPFRLADGS